MTDRYDEGPVVTIQQNSKRWKTLYLRSRQFLGFGILMIIAPFYVDADLHLGGWLILGGLVSMATGGAMKSYAKAGAWWHNG